jgi:hypothetical protein
MNPLKLIGRKVRYEGAEGRVRSIHAGKGLPPELRIARRVPVGEADRFIDVPESEWDKVQILPD